ncbi:hypothetical protein Tco_0016555, partial [Tanacetum coccineum]
MCMSKFRGGLGFRHLGLFNRSLLAKQVWRLITSLTTLAARILKARYFPRLSFFDAKIGYRPSYIWRSFLSVKDIVHKGCKWNIGNGRSVNVWNDFWVDDHRSLGPKPNNYDVNQGNVETIARLVLSEHHKANQREIISTLHNTHRGVWLRPEIDVIKDYNGEGGNKVAHSIASLALSCDDEITLDEESDLDFSEVKDYKPRKQLGDEVIEQEVYGIDPYT